MVLDANASNQDGQTVISGEATVLAPTERIERPRGTLPQVRISLAQGDDLVRCCSTYGRSAASRWRSFTRATQ